ncbi:ubl carboxyl-terminal hydrolase 18 [Alligator mississippiensis]|nr:ubl carboxyl-terminal hydrolase 18 [Alligator mississippiensis]
MGQGTGRETRSNKSELPVNLNMKAAAEVEKDTGKVMKNRDQKLISVYGVADLNNGAIGLYNTGLSCCLNSLLQVFFMNRHFTVILRRITVPFSSAEQRKNVPYQMLLLLEEMQRGKREAVYPLELSRCLSLHGVELFVQHDAAQLLLILWNLIKSQITNMDLVERLTALYTIWVQEYLVCQRCSFETNRDSHMITLPLPMFDSRSYLLRTLEDSLQCFFQPEQLTGNDMCFCEQCKQKTPCLQGTRLKHLPLTLTLHLKRFYCKKSTRTQKISHSLPFPQSLNFNDILTQEQCHTDAKDKVDWQYDLFAVVAHLGSANFGHYCAYTRSLTDHQWYCFNDSSVCQVSWDDIKCTYGNADLRWGETAYLLVYMKKNPQQPHP